MSRETSESHWYSISAEFAGALLLIPWIYTRWVSLYALPLMIGASQFWLVRKGFYFTGAGAELPLVWSIMLAVQAMLGDGPFAIGSLGQVLMSSNQRLERSRIASSLSEGENG